MSDRTTFSHCHRVISRLPFTRAVIVFFPGYVFTLVTMYLARPFSVTLTDATNKDTAALMGVVEDQVRELLRSTRWCCQLSA